MNQPKIDATSFKPQSKMKKTILSLLLLPLVIPVYAKTPVQANEPIISAHHSSTDSQLTVANKKIVTDFYHGIFTQHQVKEYSDRYIGSQYIQHNPHVPDGKAPFVNYFTQYFKDNPKAKNTIKRVIAEGDLVVLHVHSTENDQDRGTAIVDVFRVENGKIVEHWDVQQDIPEPSANANTMF